MLNDILSYLQFQIGAMDLSFNWTNFLEVLIIAVILYAFYKNLSRIPSLKNLLKGIFYSYFFVWVFSEIFDKIGFKNPWNVFEIHCNSGFTEF